MRCFYLILNPYSSILKSGVWCLFENEREELKALLIQVLAVLKDSFERVIFWLILAVFLFLSVRLGMQWGHNEEIGISVEAEFGLEQKYNPAVLNKDIPKEEILGASAGLFTKKPILYYRDFYKRNAFSSVPGLKLLR